MKDRDTDRETDTPETDLRDQREEKAACLKGLHLLLVINQFLSSSPFQSPYRTVLLAAAHENLEALRGV